MYTLLHHAPNRKALLLQIVPFAGALVTAELFYKFHSFTLECLAFLATWFALDWVISAIGRLAARAKT